MFAGERRQRNAPANVADEPRAGPQRGGVSPPNSSGTPDKGPLAGAAERIGSRRFANGSAVHRQTRRMEPPGCTRSEQSDVCESGGSSATFGIAMKALDKGYHLPVAFSMFGLFFTYMLVRDLRTGEI